MQPSRVWIRRLALGLLLPDLPKLVAADLAAVFGRICLFDNRLEPSCLSVFRIAYGPTLVKEKTVRLVVPVHRVVIRAVRGKRHERGEKDDPRDCGEHGQHPAPSGQKDVGPEVGNAGHGSASQSDSHTARRAPRGTAARADLCSHDRCAPRPASRDARRGWRAVPGGGELRRFRKVPAATASTRRTSRSATRAHYTAPSARLALRSPCHAHPDRPRARARLTDSNVCQLAAPRRRAFCRVVESLLTADAWPRLQRAAGGEVCPCTGSS